MKNKNAETFVDGLKASLGYRMPEETRSLYIAKLSKWILPTETWTRALDETIKSNESGFIPSLSTIYKILKETALPDYSNRQFGGIYFYGDRENSYKIPCEIIIMDGHAAYVYPPWHKRAGQVPILPASAHDIREIPDNPADDYRDRPTEEEVKVFMDKIRENFSKIKGMDSPF